VPEVSPFDGLLYDTSAGSLSSLTAPPYDVILPHDLARYHRASPYNVARADLVEAEGEALADKYKDAASSLRAWRDEGVLRQEGRPRLYAYEMTFMYRAEQRRVRGVIAELALEPLGRGVVPHERTMPGPVADRLAHLRATRANLAPIYLVAGGPLEEQTALLDEAAATAPDREVVDEEGVRHRLWVVEDRPGLRERYRGEPLLIADGHHRYQTALAFQEEMRRGEGSGPWDAIMALLVDGATEDPPILPIHRVASVEGRLDMPGERVRDLGEILAWLAEDDLRFGAAYRETGELVHQIGRLEGEPPTVSALHQTLLDGLEGVRDVAFVHDPGLAEELVHRGERDLALFLPPARVSNVRAVVETGGRLPQKSTYFWPKPRTGMVVRSLG